MAYADVGTSAHNLHIVNSQSASEPASQNGPDVMQPRPVLIDARTLVSCRHRLHLDTAHPLLIVGAPEDSGILQRREAAAAHREIVRETLTTASGGWVQIESAGSTASRAASTLQALADGADRIWGAVLPPEPDTGRRGRSEMLIRDVDRGGYIPVIVVNHKVTDPRNGDGGEGGALTSDLLEWDPRENPQLKIRPQLRDQLRLAHLYRMLQRHGFASPALLGGAIGFSFDCILVHDLTNVLDEYDRRFADRIAIARGESDTVPSSIPECRSCPWWSRCKQRLTEMRDVSLVAPGSRAEVLRAVGVHTIDELAHWDGPAPEDWQHGDFADAVVTAKAWLKGVPLVRRIPKVTVRRADVEVDVDPESYQEHGAYLLGTLLKAGRRPADRGVVALGPVPTIDEGRSFGEFWTWLSEVRERTVAAGKTFAAYCYSRSAEDKWLYDSARRFAGLPGVPTVEDVRAFVDSDQWVDIYQAVSEQFICPNGKGLKKIAPVAGFSWRDSDAGGEQSMSWYRDAVGYDADPDLGQRTRLLEYNEDDVFATKTLREWMTDRADHDVPFAGDM